MSGWDTLTHTHTGVRRVLPAPSARARLGIKCDMVWCFVGRTGGWGRWAGAYGLGFRLPAERWLGGGGVCGGFEVVSVYAVHDNIYP